MSVVTAVRDKVSAFATEAISDNPVIVREFRTRMRGAKAFMVMGGYALFLSGMSFIGYVSIWNRYVGPSGFSASIVNHSIGMELFMWLWWTQAILLSLIIPSLTFSSITLELEKKTMEMLALTRLTAGKIVVGKHLAGFLYALVLMVCSLPIACICLVFGGISPAEIALSYVALVAWCFLLTSFGVFWSSLFRRTASAALFSYGTTGLYFLLTIPLGVMTANSYYGSGGAHAHALGALNPGWAPYSIVMSANVCGVKIPLALAAVVLHFAVGAALLLSSSTHVKFMRAERSLPVKLLVMAISAVLLWCFAGDSPNTGFAATYGNRANAIMDYAMVAIVTLALGAAVFATGQPRAREGLSTWRYALSLRKVFKGDVGGAIGFMVLWSAALYGTLGVTLHWASRSKPFAVPAWVWGGYWHAGVAVLAFAAAMAAFGVLMSRVTRVRRNAAALVVLFAIVAFAGYGIVMAYWVDGVTDSSGPVWQLAALWPVTPLISSMGEWKHMPKLWWPAKDAWIVCSLAWLAVAAVCLGIASGPASKYPGVVED